MALLLEFISGELCEHERLLGRELARVESGDSSGGLAGGERGRRATQAAARAPATLHQSHSAPPAEHVSLPCTAIAQTHKHR